MISNQTRLLLWLVTFFSLIGTVSLISTRKMSQIFPEFQRHLFLIESEKFSTFEELKIANLLNDIREKNDVTLDVSSFVAGRSLLVNVLTHEKKDWRSHFSTEPISAHDIHQQLLRFIGTQLQVPLPSIRSLRWTQVPNTASLFKGQILTIHKNQFRKESGEILTRAIDLSVFSTHFVDSRSDLIQIRIFAREAKLLNFTLMDFEKAIRLVAENRPALVTERRQRIVPMVWQNPNSSELLESILNTQVENFSGKKVLLTEMANVELTKKEDWAIPWKSFSEQIQTHFDMESSKRFYMIWDLKEVLIVLTTLLFMSIVSLASAKMVNFGDLSIVLSAPPITFIFGEIFPFQEGENYTIVLFFLFTLVWFMMRLQNFEFQKHRWIKLLVVNLGLPLVGIFAIICTFIPNFLTNFNPYSNQEIQRSFSKINVSKIRKTLEQKNDIINDRVTINGINSTDIGIIQNDPDQKKSDSSIHFPVVASGSWKVESNLVPLAPNIHQNSQSLFLFIVYLATILSATLFLQSGFQKTQLICIGLNQILVAFIFLYFLPANLETKGLVDMDHSNLLFLILIVFLVSLDTFYSLTERSLKFQKIGADSFQAYRKSTRKHVFTTSLAIGFCGLVWPAFLLGNLFFNSVGLVFIHFTVSMAWIWFIIRFGINIEEGLSYYRLKLGVRKIRSLTGILSKTNAGAIND